MAVTAFRISPAHRHRQEAILNVNGVRGQDETEETPFFTIVWQADSL